MLQRQRLLGTLCGGQVPIRSREEGLGKSQQAAPRRTAREHMELISEAQSFIGRLSPTRRHDAAARVLMRACSEQPRGCRHQSPVVSGQQAREGQGPLCGLRSCRRSQLCLLLCEGSRENVPSVLPLRASQTLEGNASGLNCHRAAPAKGNTSPGQQRGL